jgi:hypothetical protein
MYGNYNFHSSSESVTVGPIAFDNPRAGPAASPFYYMRRYRCSFGQRSASELAE